MSKCSLAIADKARPDQDHQGRLSRSTSSSARRELDDSRHPARIDRMNRTAWRSRRHRRSCERQSSSMTDARRPAARWVTSNLGATPDNPEGEPLEAGDRKDAAEALRAPLQSRRLYPELHVQIGAEASGLDQERLPGGTVRHRRSFRFALLQTLGQLVCGEIDCGFHLRHWCNSGTRGSTTGLSVTDRRPYRAVMVKTLAPVASRI